MLHIHESNSIDQYIWIIICWSLNFWSGLGLSSQRPITKKSNLAKILTGKNELSCEIPSATMLQKKTLKITMYLGLDIIIKLKFTTDFDRCAILNVLN